MNYHNKYHKYKLKFEKLNELMMDGGGISVCEKVKKVLQKHMIKYDELMELFSEHGDNGFSIKVFDNLFKKPITTIYKYNDCDYDGKSFYIYKYKKYYILLKGNYGSCCVCDKWASIVWYDESEYESDKKYANEHRDIVESELMRLVDNMNIYRNLNDIRLSLCEDINFVKDFNKFKKSYNGA